MGSEAGMTRFIYHTFWHVRTNQGLCATGLKPSCLHLVTMMLQASYQHAFGALRQLALLLRSALGMKSADGYKQVYCWQTVNCMELWAKVMYDGRAIHRLAWARI